MALINEILIGTYPQYNNMTMYRKYDGENGFIPYFRFTDDNTLSTDSNITVNYIEYFKNSSGQEVPELRRYKYYVVPNRVTSYYSPGEMLPAGTIAVGGETVPNSEYVNENGDTVSLYYNEGDAVIEGTIAIGGELKQEEWLAANNWFLSLARTPIAASVGIMDSIEYILSVLPMEVPNGFILPGES